MNFPTQSWFMTPSLGYIKKVLTPKPSIGYDPSSLIGFWPQDEKSGLVSLDHSSLGHHGVYTGVTLGQAGVPGMGLTSPFYDGANDYNNIYSAALNADFDGAEGTLLAWIQVANAGVWTDGISRRIANLEVDGNNFIILDKPANNTIRGIYKAGGVTETGQQAGITTLDFFPFAMTWSATDDEVNYYYSGGLFETDTVLGIWVGNLKNNATVIGAGSLVPALVWHGNIGPVLLYNEAKTAAEVAYLSTS